MSIGGNVSETENQAYAAQCLKLLGSTKSGASWFFWIAGLSVVNAVVLLAEGGWRFLIGLGLTDLVVELFGPGNWSALFFALIIAGMYVLFGFMGRKRRTWGFVVGIVMYSLDALLLLPIRDWLSIGFHVFALVFIIPGLIACIRLNKLDPMKFII